MKKFFSYVAALLIVFSCAHKSEVILPKTLLFSPITPEYLQDTATSWQQTGFDGFLFDQIMSNWADDIWATDGDSTSRGENDVTFQRVKKCNEECQQVGITENFVKIAFYSQVPLWTNEKAWEKFLYNFSEVARFAKLTSCRGIALDIEYVSEQYELDWKGYDFSGYTEFDLHRAALKRGEQLVQSMLAQYPEMVFLMLPEGFTFYGPLAADFLVGAVKGMAAANAPGGLHLLTEATYDITSTLGLIHYKLNLETKIVQRFSESMRRYWKDKCSIALGGWPLGYYRKIVNVQGEFIGWSGKEEKFGNQIVGSYADKSSRFSPQEFRNQYAGLLLGSGRYCWIYGHGATWWQFSEKEAEKYGQVSNSELPAEAQLAEYKAIVRDKWMSTPDIQALADLIKNGHTEEYLSAMNFIKQFHVIGPFGCASCNNFDTQFSPEKEINLRAEYQGSLGKAKWQTLSIDLQSGYLDFVPFFHPTDWVCVYAFCEVVSVQEQSAQLRLGTNDMGALWFNGQKVFSHNGERTAALDDDIIPVRLNKGTNSILVKVCNTELNWGMYLRITDEKGEALQNLEFVTR